MAKTGRPKKLQLEVTKDQQTELERIIRQARTQRAVSFRAKIILECARGRSNVEVGNILRTSNFTVGFWRNRFIKGGIDALYDEPRPGTPRKISDDQVERVVQLTLEKKPKGATHWSSRMLARKLGMSQSAVSRIWRAFGLQPHRVDSFQLSSDPFFVEKVRDVVGLYMNPPTNALILCVDEKSQIQALSRSQPVLPMRIGKVEQHTHDYLRHGTTSLFAALDVATGRVIGKCFSRHRSREFKKFLEHIDASVPSDLEIHIVLDNYATHKTPLIKRWLLKRPRYHLHFTPTHSSWLNMVERWFALLTERQIKRGSHQSVDDLVHAIDMFLSVTNSDPKPFQWTKTADQILSKVARFASDMLKAHV